jgi:hypothetical protein
MAEGAEGKMASGLLSITRSDSKGLFIRRAEIQLSAVIAV